MSLSGLERLTFGDHPPTKVPRVDLDSLQQSLLSEGPL